MVPLSTDPFHEWQTTVENLIQTLLNQIKNTLIKKYSLKLPSILISSCLEQEFVSEVIKLKTILNQIGVSVFVEELKTADELSQQLKQCDQAIIVCTKEYAQRVVNEPKIREVIAQFGQSGSDCLFPLLCEGGFGDVALKIVDKHFLIRAYHGAFSKTQSLTCLESLINVFLHFSGTQGLGILPDLLDLEKKVNAGAYVEYKTYFQSLEDGQREATRGYLLKSNVLQQMEKNRFNKCLNTIESTELEKIDKLLSHVLESGLTSKTGLLLCPRKSDTFLTNGYLETQLFKQNKWMVVSINCGEFRGRNKQRCVEAALKRLKLNSTDINSLKRSENVVIIFKNYEDLETYDNLYVKNQLINWKRTKVFVSCVSGHFQFRDFQSCFINDPTNPNLESLQTVHLKAFAPEIEGNQNDKIEETGEQTSEEDEREVFLSLKRTIQQTELTSFLRGVNEKFVQDGILNSNIDQNVQGFISYAWEQEKNKLVSQQGHLSNIVSDLRALGISTWLDIERMTGDINQQMAGNIEQSEFILLIGTPLYTQRAANKETNVHKEYHNIKRAKQLRVFALRFYPDSGEVKAFPPEIESKSEMILNFEGIDDGANYLTQMTSLENPIGLIPRILKLNDSDKEQQQRQYKTLLKGLEGQLQLLVIKMVIEKSQDLVQMYDIDNKLKSYIQPSALHKEDDELDSRFNLGEYFTSFLQTSSEEDHNHPLRKAFIVMGRSGSGKSLFTLSVFKKFLKEWQEWLPSQKHDQPSWLPVYVGLKEFVKIENIEDALTLSLKRNYELQDLDVEALREGLGMNQKVLFILDGYDELGNGVRPNFLKKLGTWKNAKVLISCRPEHFENEGQHLEAFSSNGEVSSFTIIYLSPFSSQEIEQYIDDFEKQNINLGNTPTTSQATQSTFERIQSIPGLMSLLDNPFLLNLVLQSLPRLMETHQNSSSSIKRADIYQAFTDTTFNKESFKQQETHNQLISLSEYHEFAERLAFQLFRQRSLGISHQNEALWKEFLEKGSVSVREACPLKRTGDQVNFVHKSVFEYFVAVHMWHQLNQEEILNSIEIWNQRLLTEERAVVDFLVEFFQENRSFYSHLQQEIELDADGHEVRQNSLKAKRRLFEMINSSKGDQNVCQAAANAITVLNSSGIHFWGQDFSRINIRGADLRGSICNYVNFENADLTDVQFDGASLAEANFRGASMEGVEFGELVAIEVDSVLSWGCRFSPDGKMIGCCSGSLIEFFDTRSKERLSILEGHQAEVRSLAFHPTEDLIASSSEDKTIRLWSLKTGDCIVLEGHTQCVFSVNFSFDGRLLASAGDSSVRLWNVPNGESNKVLEFESRVTHVSFSRNNELLAYGCWDGTVGLWDLRKEETIHRFQHSERVWMTEFSPDGQLLATCSEDHTVKIWNLVRKVEIHSLEEHSGIVYALSFSPNGDFLSSVGDDWAVRLWNVERGEMIKNLLGHRENVYGVHFHPNGKMIASTAGDKSVHFWETQQKYVPKSRDSSIYSIWSLNFSPQGDVIASSGEDENVQLWETSSGCLKKLLIGHTGSVPINAFSLDGKLLATGSYDTTVRVWNLQSGEFVTLTHHSESVRAVHFSSQFLISGSDDGRVFYYEVGHFDPHLFYSGTSPIASARITPDGEILAFADENQEIFVWNLQKKELLHVFRGHQEYIKRLVLHPNRNILASGGWDNIAKMWDLDSPHCVVDCVIKRESWYPDTIDGLDFVFDGQFLVTCSSDQVLRFWKHNPDGSSSVVREIRCGSSLYAVSWFQKERLMAIGHDDGSLRMWKLELCHESVNAELMWVTKRNPFLDMSNSNLDGIKQLTLPNYQLMKQRGGRGQPEMISSLSRAAESGDSNAQLELAKLYKEGQRLKKDLKRSFELLSLAAQENPEAQYELGLCFFKGEGVTQSPTQGIWWLKMAAKHGNISAQLMMSELLSKGESIEKDRVGAFKWLEKAAKQGHHESLYLVAEMYRTGQQGVSPSSEHATKFFDRLQSKELATNFAEREYKIGQYFMSGDGTERNLHKAFNWFLKASKHGHEDAQKLIERVPKYFPNSIQGTFFAAEHGDRREQTKLGKRYLLGKGIGKDLEKAFKWLSQATQHTGDGDGDDDDDDGDGSDSQFWLALCYEDGGGSHFEQSSQKSFELFKKSSTQNWISHFHLGVSYAEGWGVEQDAKSAQSHFHEFFQNPEIEGTLEKWKEKMSRQTVNMFRMGYIYLHGVGSVVKNVEEGIRLMSLAAEKRHAAAQEILAHRLAQDSEVSN